MNLCKSGKASFRVTAMSVTDEQVRITGSGVVPILVAGSRCHLLLPSSYSQTAVGPREVCEMMLRTSPAYLVLQHQDENIARLVTRSLCTGWHVSHCAQESSLCERTGGGVATGENVGWRMAQPEVSEL